jgi:hypothetical protein
VQDAVRDVINYMILLAGLIDERRLGAKVAIIPESTAVCMKASAQ